MVKNRPPEGFCLLIFWRFVRIIIVKEGGRRPPVGTKLVCTNCKRKYKVSRWHTKVHLRCQACGGMLSGDLTAYYKHVVAHPTRYNGRFAHSIKAFAKVAAVAFLFGVLVTAVMFTWYRNTQVPRLMTQLQSADETVWTEAMEDLVEVGQRAVPALVGAVAGEDEALSQRALTALERLGDKAVEPLVGLLARSDERLSGHAAGLLPRVSSRRALPQLRKLYASQADPGVRVALLYVFEKYPGMELLRLLIASLDLAAEGDQVQAINQRVDALCRRILEEAARDHPDLEVPQPPSGPEEWSSWLGEHEERLNALTRAGRGQPRPTAAPEAP